MKDKIALLMEETDCERGEAELALELCGYDVENAMQVVLRLSQSIAVFKGRLRAPQECIYGLWLVILDLKTRALLRARAVVSYNPAVYASDLDAHWFDFEGRLYACRLWAGALQGLSQEVEQSLSAAFASPEFRGFYQEGAPLQAKDLEPLKAVLREQLGGSVDLQVRQDLLDMGEFREVRPQGAGSGARKARRPRAARGRSQGPGAGPGGILIIQVALDPDPEGTPCSGLSAGDMVYATINDQRDIAQYLSKLFGARSEEGVRPLLVPVEAIEKQDSGVVTIRVRFSAGVCGDVTMPGDLRLKAVQKPGKAPWWKKIFGRA
jgi:hypothetical protein